MRRKPVLFSLGVGIVAAPLLLFTFWHPLLTNAKDSRVHSSLESEAPFQLLAARGNWLDGFEVLRLDESGGCHYTFEDAPSARRRVGGAVRPVWKRASFRIPPAKVAQIRSLLLECRFAHLSSTYQDPEVSDGLLLILDLKVGGERKTVWCGNLFPAQVERLKTCLFEELISEHPQAIQQADQLPQAELLLEIDAVRRAEEAS